MANTPGTLYVVATPIGNLGDLSRRAGEVLARVEHVAAEDTRRTRQLLTHLGISGKSLHRVDAHASAGDVDAIVDLLAEGHDVAFATDAGTPAVSDPGSVLVARTVARGLTVVPLPGPSAVLAALVGSGLSDDRGFRFVGFLSRDGACRRDDLRRIADTAEPVVFFESPHRIQDTLRELADLFPERACAVCRELTKLHEEIVRGTLAELASSPREYRGEIVVVLGAHDPGEREHTMDDAAIDARITRGLDEGVHPKALSEILAAASGRPKREMYERVVKAKSDRRR
ncbi:MAG: 16S rRNA (cytidine(1402)-2'-O)-methyltransferase [Myxococcales bacterium]|nr:16S rRNA (cytidine(1402)-2'-O)-methyltransferase [Myxococcales bacterium]